MIDTTSEPEHFAELRRIAEDIRARGDCGCTVVLEDGTLATFNVHVPDPYAALPNGKAEDT